MRGLVVLPLLLGAMLSADRIAASECARAEQLTAEARGVVPRDIAMAEQKLRQALELCPQSAAIHYNLGILLYMRRQYDEATSMLEASLRIAPQYAPSLNALAFLLLGQASQHPRALNLASQAVDLEVGNAEYLDTLTRVQALEAVGRVRGDPLSTGQPETGPMLWVQAHPGEAKASGVALGGAGAEAVSRYLAGTRSEAGLVPLVAVAGDGAAELARVVEAGEVEVFRLEATDRPGFYVVVPPTARDADTSGPPVARAQACSGRTTHVVRPGDTLGIIAQRYYRNSSLWEAIYTCNRRLIGADPGLLTPGSTLLIP